MARMLKTPARPRLADGSVAGGWWHALEPSGRIHCDLCPRSCSLKPGDRGFCFVRQNIDGEMILTTYGRSTGFCVDPIEKKPLNHFLPGTAVLSFGTAGCNLGCKFCQNWDISKSRAVERASESAEPETIAEAAVQLECHSVAFTYNDPVIWAEYAIDTALACHERGIKTVAVTAGYITSDARREFYEVMDAANVDLKAFSEEFYQHLTSSHLQPVLETLRWLKHETDVWFEITNLIIPQENDSSDEIRRMCDWMLNSIGDEVPVHFTAFHPDFRLRDRASTSLETLLMAYDTAKAQGIKYVYVGNVHDPAHDSTYCPFCETLLIERNWHELGAYHLQGDRCPRCQGQIAGRFLERPGQWGRNRLPVNIAQFAARTTQLSDRSAGPEDSQKCTSPEVIRSTTEVVRRGLQLSELQERQILRAAGEAVVAGVCQRSAQLTDPSLGGAAQRPVAGAFVTLKRGTQLRACCGFLGSSLPLIEALQNAAHRTACNDTRLPPISPSELPYLHMHVSLLHDFQPITQTGAARAQAVSVGTHGLTIQRGDSGGLLLPSVAAENEWDGETFLRHVCRKAGLPTTAWQDDEAKLQTFEAHLIDGPLDPDLWADAPQESPSRFLPEDIRQLAEHCRRNVIALVQGATPDYYLTSCPDANVQGVALSVKFAEQHSETTSARLSFRPGLPLQSTLFQCAEAVARSVQSFSLSNDALQALQADVAVLYDSAMHGTVADAQLKGLDPHRRALLIIERDRYAWTYDRDLSPEALLRSTAEKVQVLAPATAGVYSLAADCTCRSLTVTNVPHPQKGPGTRPPAVAGVFYPEEPAALGSLVEALFAGGSAPRAEPWSAVLVPHAGLRFSGRIAAEVLKSVEIPSRVIVLAPKHTRLGTPWAVAPHDTWSLPGQGMAADPDWARRLAEAVPGLNLDAAAHKEEHAIEVLLPLLRHVAPHSCVIGITIGDGDLEQCQRFAQHLANVLRKEEPRPLLVISSDLNHYAAEVENRRLDRLAIDALASRDPAHLFRTVREHDISMCGMLPAVIVMQSLRNLGQLTQCREVAYGTSADAGGSADRVVGYVGMLLR
ncbi:MAG: AmmeMemoRadiSam system radical SAM enzyme [Pirellulaceae bacterium]